MEYKKLDELLEYIQPTKYIVDSENYDDSFPTPVLTAGKSFILGYTDETNGIYFASKENPIILFDDFTTECKLVDFAFKVKSSACKILKPKKDINIKYVYYAMKNIDIDTALHKRYWISIYSQQTIPFPIPIIQENIVSEIEIINETIEYNEHKIKYLEELIKSQFIEMFGDCDNYDLIGNVLNICRGASPRPISNYITSNEDGVNWIKIGDVDENSLYITSTEEKITKEGALKSRAVKPGDFILSNSMSFGRPYILGINGCVHDGWLILSDYENTFNPLYLYHAIRDDEVQYQFNGRANGATVRNLNSELVRNTSIKIPSINQQNKFADFVQQIDKSKLIVQQEIKLLNELLEVKTNEYFS